MKLFDLDSPIMRILTKIADLMLLNILTLLCCIPVVTAGAGFTALHYMALKMVRNEESYIVKGFFKSFKQNFKQATIIWLLLLAAVAVLVGDLFIMNQADIAFGSVIKVIVLAVGIIVLFIATFIFPTLAKFDNTVFRTIKNALGISILQLPKTILMIVMNCVPVLLLMVVQLVPFSLLLGFSVPAYGSAFLYNKFFKKLEDQIQAAQGGDESTQELVADDERIFHDEVDESLSINQNIRR